MIEYYREVLSVIAKCRVIWSVASMSDSTRILDSSATLPATNDSLINPNVPILPRTLNVLRPDEGLGRRGTGPVLFSVGMPSRGEVTAPGGSVTEPLCVNHSTTSVFGRYATTPRACAPSVCVRHADASCVIKGLCKADAPVARNITLSLHISARQLQGRV
jgi:hypothetical protein